MSYKTYITEALVCGSRIQNTADKSYLLFTREAGMLYANARSVREERSKQRFALQEFSHIRATLIHGKTGWRVAGVEPIANLYAVRSTRASRTLVRNIIRLLRRFLQGESPHPELFDDVLKMLSVSEEENMAACEEVITIRTLASLGYIAPIPAVKGIIESKDMIASAQSLEPAFATERAKLIEQALQESHL